MAKDSKKTRQSKKLRKKVKLLRQQFRRLYWGYGGEYEIERHKKFAEKLSYSFEKYLKINNAFVDEGFLDSIEFIRDRLENTISEHICINDEYSSRVSSYKTLNLPEWF